MIEGEPVDIGIMCQLASTCMRLSTRLGLERVPREVQSLDSYLKTIGSNQA